jgi:hypothetical protein
MLSNTPDAFYHRDNLGLPQFVGVPYKLDKDYNASLNRIINESLFSDFDVA